MKNRQQHCIQKKTQQANNCPNITPKTTEMSPSSYIEPMVIKFIEGLMISNVRGEVLSH